ncbi:MAG: PAS domain S-box protein, partial [Gammaproteobacteria bacterium]
NIIVRPVERLTIYVRRSRDGIVMPPETASLDNTELGALATAFYELITRRDTTERRLTRLAAALDSAGDAVAILGSDRTIEYVNARYEQLSGYTAADMVGTLSARHTSDRDTADAMWATVENGDTWFQQVKTRRKNGTSYDEEITASPIADAQGRLVACVVLKRDVSVRVRADDERQRLVAAVEHAGDSIELLDDRGLVIYVNPAFERRTGHLLEVIKGLHTDSVSDFTESGDSYAEMLRTTRHDGQLWSGPLRRRLPDNRLVEEDTTVSPIRDAQHRITAFVIVSRDISERLALESQLSRAQKLEAIGQLAAGIAHEINTPAQYVGDNIRFLQESFRDIAGLLERLPAFANTSAASTAGSLAEALATADLAFLCEEIPLALRQSAEGCERISTIVRAMKDFSHPAQDMTPVDLHRAIQSTITVASNEWKYVADMRTCFDPDLPLVTCLPGAFNQVILNMLVNAAHAIEDVVGDGSKGKGTITVTTRNLGASVEVTVSDTGSGISQAIREKIFDPFFTTKVVGKGTGQGLAIAHDVIVTKHGGSIALESMPGNGTTFIITLPVSPQAGVKATAVDTGGQSADVAFAV